MSRRGPGRVRASCWRADSPRARGAARLRPRGRGRREVERSGSVVSVLRACVHTPLLLLARGVQAGAPSVGMEVRPAPPGARVAVSAPRMMPLSAAVGVGESHFILPPSRLRRPAPACPLGLPAQAAQQMMHMHVLRGAQFRCLGARVSPRSRSKPGRRHCCGLIMPPVQPPVRAPLELRLLPAKARAPPCAARRFLCVELNAILQQQAQHQALKLSYC